MTTMAQQPTGGTRFETHAQKADRKQVRRRDVLIRDRQQLSEVGTCVIGGAVVVLEQPLLDGMLRADAQCSERLRERLTQHLIIRTPPPVRRLLPGHGGHESPSICNWLIPRSAYAIACLSRQYSGRGRVHRQAQVVGVRICSSETLLVALARVPQPSRFCIAPKR